MLEQKPLLTTDGRYIWAHHLGMKLGPFVAKVDENGQVGESNREDPNGVPFNPESCIGGKIHTIENPMFPPKEMFEEIP